MSSVRSRKNTRKKDVRKSLRHQSRRKSRVRRTTSRKVNRKVLKNNSFHKLIRKPKVNMLKVLSPVDNLVINNNSTNRKIIKELYEHDTKFWEISYDTESGVLTTRFGKKGTEGKSSSKKDSLENVEKLVHSKINKGYKLINSNHHSSSYSSVSINSHNQNSHNNQTSNTNNKISEPLTIYTAEWCGYCKKLKELLNEKNIKYSAYDIDDGDNRKTVDEITNGYKYVPVILDSNNKFIGGYSELKKLLNIE